MERAHGAGIAFATGSVTKIQIIETIGDTGLLLPELIAQGLAANDRIKYFLTLLQTANQHAQHPLNVTVDLRGARQSSGVGDATLDDVVAKSRLTTDGIVFIPAVSHIQRLLFDDVRRMLEPLHAAAAIDPEWRTKYEGYRQRLDARIEAAPTCADDELAARTIDALTGAGDESHDTVHRIVMELHRELNRMLADVALESVDGARASGLTATDRALVAAFMKGVNATAALKFDHPGLATTAARYGDRLSIQNDLGTTEGHVVIVQITDSVATIIYTDVHRRRIQFLRDMLEQFAVDWQPGAAASGDIEMIVGRYTAAGPAALEQFLTYFGSRLVFLIDWNRARKRLEQFVSRADAVAVLRWAADNNVGHRAFLQLGDVRLIYTAFERIAPTRIRYGARLDELIGGEAATGFLRAVLRITAAGLKDGHSARLIQDEIEAELLSHIATTEHDILDAASEHAMLASALAERVRHALARLPGAYSKKELERTAVLAKTWEARADEMVRNAARRLDRTDAARVLKRLLEEADNVTDALEDTAFLLTLLPDHARPDAVATLHPLADIVTEAVKEYIRCLEYARDCSRLHTHTDVDEALVAIDRIAELEHACDAAERTARTVLFAICADFRELQVLSDIARGFEQAADALARCARMLRDYILNPDGGEA